MSEALRLQKRWLDYILRNEFTLRHHRGKKARGKGLERYDPRPRAIILVISSLLHRGYGRSEKHIQVQYDMLILESTPWLRQIISNGKDLRESN